MCQHPCSIPWPHSLSKHSASASLWHTMATHTMWQQTTVKSCSLWQHPYDIPWSHVQCDSNEVMFTVAASLWHTMATHTMWQQWSHIPYGSILVTYCGHTINVTTEQWSHIHCVSILMTCCCHTYNVTTVKSYSPPASLRHKVPHIWAPYLLSTICWCTEMNGTLPRQILVHILMSLANKHLCVMT